MRDQGTFCCVIMIHLGYERLFVEPYEESDHFPVNMLKRASIFLSQHQDSVKAINARAFSSVKCNVYSF